MMRAMILAVLVAVGGLWLSGCGKSETAKVEAKAEVPASLFGKVEGEVKDVIGIRADAKEGDKVTVYGRIAGRSEPFTEGRAMFSLADASLKTCNENPGDKCETPWDMCCEATTEVAAKSLTVRIDDASGKVLTGTLNGVHGLAPLAKVKITGKVVSRDPEGKAMTIAAEKIEVQTPVAPVKGAG